MQAFSISILLLLFSTKLTGQNATTISKTEQTKAYCSTIAEYIKVIEAKYKEFKFDTLFVNKHEEFPQIILMPVIQNKKIVLIEDNKGNKAPHNRKSFVLINIVEKRLAKDNAEFMIVTFHKDYKPQHNCFVKLKYNSVKNEFEALEKVRFEYPYAGTKN